MADSIYERLGITGAVELIRRYLPEFAKQLEITDKWWSLRLPYTVYIVELLTARQQHYEQSND